TALERGDNVILGTNHFELTDIAKIFAGINVWLAKAGYEQLLEGDSNVKRALIASQITSVMGIKMRNPDTTEGQPPTLTVPVTLALTALVHDLLKSYPNTPSIAAIRKLWEAETTLNNLRVKGTVMSLQKAGRLFLAMAPSGSQDKPLEGDPTTYLLQPLTQGTLDMMKQTRTYVLMMAMWNVEGKPIVRFSGREINGVWVPNGLASIKNDHQGNAEMTNLSTTLNHWVPGLHFVYLPAVTRDSKKKRRSSDY
ncbi:MAG TPA: hypothetical protein VN778_04805, partial [Verrucomicrobiae bacterium]|nr:hypothetical protein [Verrucomicrobiae bacterium]